MKIMDRFIFSWRTHEVNSHDNNLMGGRKMTNAQNKSKISLVLCVLLLQVVLMACNPLSSWSEPVINGTVIDGSKKTPLENVSIRILNSGFKTKSGKNGQFKLPFVPGNFNIVFEGTGIVPKAVPLSLTSKSNYPMGEISLFQFPPLIDMYKNPIEGVEITVQQASYDSQGTLLSKSNSNSKGLSLIEYSKGDLALTAKKAGYRTRTIVINTERPQELVNAQWLLPPDKPGIYYQTNFLKKAELNFTKKKMVGMMIPAYYDGTYAVSGEPEVLENKDNLTLYWVPEYGATLGENPFASKGGTFMYKVAPDGTFVVYDNGVSKGTKVDSFKINTVYNEVDSGFGGLVQQKVQIYKIDLNLPVGQYALFQGGGNSLDREPHPEKELGCWHFKIVENKK